MMIGTLSEQQVSIPASGVVLQGILTLPAEPLAAVIFAHGSGSSRLSSRNRSVANVLVKEGFGTLLFDLLTPEEDTTYANRFDIDLLTHRLKSATLWLQGQARTRDLPLGYFGASTGSASALRAAADLGSAIKAVVSRGGRPDLAGHAVSRVTAPTLLIVGGMDELVIDLNRKAFELMQTEKEMAVVPGATHLFEEPGALEEVAHLASRWFKDHLTRY